MRKAIIIMILAAVVCGCDENSQLTGPNGIINGPGGNGNGEKPDISENLNDFSFGIVNEEDEFIPWQDSVTLASTLDKVQEAFGDEYEIFETVEYDTKENRLELRLKPEDAVISSLSVTSSDTTIMKISKGKTRLDYRMKTLGVGDVNVVVKLVADGIPASKKYKIRVKEVLTLAVYVDAFWKNPSLDKIRFYCSKLPPNMDRMAMTIKDSLVVDAVCMWKDEENGIYQYQEHKKTYQFRKRKQDKVFREGKRFLVRDFGKVHDDYIEGSEYINDTTVVERRYYYEPQKAQFFIDVCSNSPYLYFEVITRQSNAYSGTEDVTHTDSETLVNDEEAVKYCTVSFAFDISEKEKKEIRDSLNNKLDKIKDNNGNDIDWEMFEGMTPEEIEEYIKNLRNKK